MSRSIEWAPAQLMRIFRGSSGRISVTKFSSQYCEIKSVFDSLKPPEITPAMKAGTEIHQALEENIMGPPVEFPVDVTTEFSAEDAHAVRLGDVVSRWTHLARTNQAREVPVYGTIKGIELKGVIDEAKIDDQANLHLIDTKTYTGKLAEYKQRLAYHQLLVYYELIGQMIRGKVDISQLAHENALGCDFSTPLHSEIQAVWGSRTLNEMIDNWKESISKLTKTQLAESVRADFIDRRTRDTNNIEFSYDDETAQQLFAFRSGMLAGLRPPMPLSRSVGSCRFCPHFTECPGRQH